MHMTVKLAGMMDDILSQAVKRGLAKTKVEALRLGVIELNNRYGLVRSVREEAEDREDAEFIAKADRRIASGKLKVLTEKELYAALKG